MYGARWNQKPPVGTLIDHSDGLAIGLAGLWAFAEGTGLPSDSASFAQATSCNASWIGSPYGPALSFNGTSQYVALGTSASIGIVGPVTIACLAAPAMGVANQTVLGAFQAASPYAGYGLRFSLGSAANNDINFWSGAYGSWVSSGAGVVDGRWHLFSVSCTSSGAVSFYLDGRPVGAGTSSAPNAYAGPRAIGARSDGAIGYLSGPMALVAVWSRAILAAEHAALAASPWQVFRPRGDAARRYAALSGRGVPYARGFSTLRPFHVPTAALSCYLD